MIIFMDWRIQKMNKQFDVFVKMKITEMSKTIHDMTYTYINP